MGIPTIMRAVVWHGPGDLRLENRPTPQLRPGTSIVRVTTAGICATDRELTSGRLDGVAPGVVPGHEITGELVAISEGSHLELGDRVVVDTVCGCGRCASCVRGAPSECVSPGELGFTADGGWAEYVGVETPRLHRVPDSLPSNEAVLAEPFAIPLGALLDCNEPIAGRRILVVGDGMAAFAFASAAFALDAGHVDVSLRHEERASLFQTINQDIHLVTGDHVEPGLADISVDTVGRSASIRTVIAGTRNRGLTICYGLADAFVQDFPLSEVVLRNLRISGHTNPRQVWPTLVGLLEDRALRTEGLVDRVVTLDDVPDVVTNWTRSFKTVMKF